MKEKTPMTREEYQKLNRKLTELKEKQASLATTCGSNGIPKLLLSQIRRLGLMLANPEIVEPSEDAVTVDDKSTVVSIDDKVTVLFENGEEEHITLVRYDGNPMKKLISAETDYGRSLLGLKVGQQGSCKTETFTVLEIQRESKDKVEETGKKL